MGENFSGSASERGKFSATICRFLLRKSCRIRSISWSDALWPMITEDCEEEDDSWASVFSYGFANARTHKPPNNIPANIARIHRQIEVAVSVRCCVRNRANER